MLLSALCNGGELRVRGKVIIIRKWPYCTLDIAASQMHQNWRWLRGNKSLLLLSSNCKSQIHCHCSNRSAAALWADLRKMEQMIINRQNSRRIFGLVRLWCAMQGNTVADGEYALDKANNRKTRRHSTGIESTSVSPLSMAASSSSVCNPL